jgi:hypothetical protein
MSGFHLIPFRFGRQRSAWQELQYYRAQRAQFVQDAMSITQTLAASFEVALQNKISGAANNAAQAALDRINALRKATAANVNQ